MPDENLNISQSLCPHCGKPVDSTASHCPHCGVVLAEEAQLIQQRSPEMLTSRLGDFLVESGAITREQLKSALEYQAGLGEKRHLLLGQALLEMGVIDRNTLDTAITMQLMTLQNALKETNRQLETNVQMRTQDLEGRLLQIRTAAEITQVATSATSPEELFRRTVQLIVDRFGYYYTSIFNVDESQKFAVLKEASGPFQSAQVPKGYRIEAGSHSIIGWVLKNCQAYVARDVQKDDLYLKVDNLPDTRSEVAVPVMMGNQLFAVLDIQHTMVNAFDVETIAVLQTIANHIASAIQNTRLLEKAENNLREIYSLYRASHQLAKSSVPEEVMDIILSTLHQSPYMSALFLVDRGGIRLIIEHKSDNSNWGGHPNGLAYPEQIAVPINVLENAFDRKANYKVVDLSEATELGAEFPATLLTVPANAECKSLALIPGWDEEYLRFLIILGSNRVSSFTPEVLESYCSLASMSVLTLGKVSATQRLEKRLAALQTLNTVSQAVSVETDLTALYKVIHREVTSIIGKVNFAVATYDEKNDTITVPYMFDGQSTRSVEAFPMGEGLTTILIRTKKSLLLVEDTERKTRELGAKQVGKPAKSWLGVPLLVGGDVIGAILLQDLDREGRFDEDDQRLLETLASQVAVAIRNARLLENTYKQASRQQQLYEITSKIRSSPDITGVLQITASELSKVLGARRAKIELGVPSSGQAEVLPIDQQENSL